MHLGLISRQEALTQGVSQFALYRKVERGEWQQLFPGIYLKSPVPPSFEQRVLAGCEWAGAVASYRTAAALFRLLDSSIVEFTTTRNLQARDGVIVHRVRALDKRDVTSIGPFPVTTPIRTLFDLAGVVDRQALRAATYEALRRGLITIEKLEKTLTRAAKGKPGVAEMRSIYKEGLDSGLERSLRLLLKKSRFDDFVAEYEVRDSTGRPMFIDFAYPNRRVAVEADSWEFHSDREAFQRDRKKWRELAKLGWTVLWFTHEDVTCRPDEVIETIAIALANNSVAEGAERLDF